LSLEISQKKPGLTILGQYDIRFSVDAQGWFRDMILSQRQFKSRIRRRSLHEVYALVKGKGTCDDYPLNQFQFSSRLTQTRAFGCARVPVFVVRRDGNHMVTIHEASDPAKAKDEM
jgi:hypothetical protein